jgi:hypothetical protein
MNNQYFICPWGKEDAIEWHPPEIEESILNKYSDCIFFGKVILALERYINENQLPLKGLTFYLTWDVDYLPTCSKSVIAVVLGDEWCRSPLFSSKVKSVFKSYGTNLPYGFPPQRETLGLDLMNLLQYIRVSILRIPYQIQNIFNIKSHRQNIYDIPLGYFRQLDLSIKDFSSRRYDIYFAGSLSGNKVPFWSLKYWLRSPKNISRATMLSMLEKISSKNSDLSIKTSSFSNFANSALPGIDDYSDNMMESKICLIPRGTSYETFRLFEAWRYGCVPVVEYLPKRWFYQNAPVVQLRSWSSLEQVVKELLSNPILLQKKHEQSLQWWREKCSEEALAKFIAEALLSSED